MLQLAVALKNGSWTVFKEGHIVATALLRSSAIRLAKGIAFEAEEAGQAVDLSVQGYFGEVKRTYSGLEDAG